MSFDAKLQATLEKCDRLANDPGATAGEREAARKKADKIRAKIGTSATDDEYKKLVSEGRTAAASMWKLGELASRVEKKYGESTLKKYATDIGMNYTTLRNARLTCLAWPNENDRPRSFSIAQDLAAQPDRAKIIARRPNIKQDEVRNIVRARNAAEPKKPKEEKSKKVAKVKQTKKVNDLKYFTDLVSIINGMMDSQGNVVSLIREADWSSVHARQGRQRVMKALQSLIGRVEKEVVYLESSDKLN